MVPEPHQETVPATPTTFTSILLNTLTHAAPFNMIENKEGVLGFTTAGTFAPVGHDRLQLQSSVPVTTLLVTAFSVIRSIGLYLFSVLTGIRPLNLTLAHLADGVEASPILVELRLRLEQVTSCTLLHMEKPTKREAWTKALEIERA